MSFTGWLFIGLSVVALIIMRFTMKDRPRSLKVFYFYIFKIITQLKNNRTKLPLALHVCVVIISMYLVFAPLLDAVKIEYLGR
jgi:hypothetical protein